MKIIFLISSLFLILTSLKIEQLNEKIYILPEINNFISPFKFSSIYASEEDIQINLTIRCTKEVTESFLFDKEYKNFCDTQNRQFSATDLNKYLNNLTIKIENNPDKMNNLFIDYTLSYTDNGVSQLLTCNQLLSKPLFIPVDTFGNFIQFKSNEYFEKEVLSIDPLYLKISGISNFELNKYYLFPNWINYSFKESFLVLSGNFPEELNDNLSLIFYLIDENSKLSSKMITIWITGPSFLEKTGNTTKITIFIMLLFLVISSVLGLIYYLRNKKKIKEEALKNSIEAEQQRKNNNIPQSVLTDSIVNWNKKMITKHRQSLKDVSQNNIESIVLTQEKNEIIYNDYVKFDSDSSFEVNRSQHSMKLEQKISVIHAPSDIEDDKKSTRSGFIDENPFN
jgi:hypothetical protein